MNSNGGEKMSQTITLSIQEVVDDFEKIVRYDEQLDVLFDNKKADNKKIEEFYNVILEMTKKYIPTYKKHVGNVDEINYDNALKLYEMIYENFKEIFYKLV